MYVSVDSKVVGVASDVPDGMSRFTFLAHPRIVDFINKWQRNQVDPSTKQSVEVKTCGVDALNTYCRN
jgi:hypothetical protein